MAKQASSFLNGGEARQLGKFEHRGLDAAALACLGDLTVLAARACDAQYALISLSIGGICRVVSKTGWSTHDQDPFVGYVKGNSSDVFVVSDTLADDRFPKGTLAAPLAKHKIRFYAGAAVRDSSGRALGTFVVMDNKRRELTPAQSDALQALARQASGQLELCRGLQELSHDIAEIKKMQAEVFAADRLTLVGRLASSIAHEVNNPLACVVSNLSFAANEVSRISAPGSREIIQALEEASQGAERIRLTIQALRRLSQGNEESISDFQIRYALGGPSRED
jgi:signal transduction histidine kinase